MGVVSVVKGLTLSGMDVPVHGRLALTVLPEEKDTGEDEEQYKEGGGGTSTGGVVVVHCNLR